MQVFLFSAGTHLWVRLQGGMKAGPLPRMLRVIFILPAHHKTAGVSPVRAHAGNSDAFVAKLTADGTILWHTFLGSNSVDHGNAIAVDSAGNVYVTGFSPVGWGTPLMAYSGGSDAFVAALDTNGNLLWHTFLGTETRDEAYGIALDDSSNIYITGLSDASWGAPVNGHSGSGPDAFGAMLNSSGTLVWNTFMGAGTDRGSDIAVNESGNVYITGYSILTWGSPINPHAGGSTDAFVACLNSSGGLVWNTFMGSSAADYAYCLTVDRFNNLWVAGLSSATWGIPLNDHAGDTDAFIAKLRDDGSPVWHTFMGSSSPDAAYDITHDHFGNVFVTGNSDATWGSPDQGHSGSYDIFVLGLNSEGSLFWNTFQGSAGDDFSQGIVIGNGTAMYVAGRSNLTWGDPLMPHSGGTEVAAVKFDVSDVSPANIIWIHDVGVGHNRLVLPDINGDGYDELLLYEDYEQIRVVSGADGFTELWSYQLSVEAYRFRRGLQVIDDLDDDGISDIIAIAGTSGNDYGQNYDDDEIFAISGAITPPGNRLLWFGGEALNIGYGVNLPIVLPDTNGDGYSDTFANTSTPDAPYTGGDHGFHISGRDGTILWDVDSSIWDIYGRVAAPDLDGDGIADIVVSGAGGTGGVEAWKGGGTEAANIWRALPGLWIRNPAVIGDLTGDGVPEVAVARFNEAPLGVYVLNGADGTAAWPSPFTFGNTASTIEKIGDVNNSGFEDIAIGSYFINNVGGTDYSVYALEGDPNAATRVVWSYDVGQNNYVKAIGDINNDGIKDVIVTGSHSELLVLNGADGTILTQVSFLSGSGGAQMGEFNNAAGDDILTSMGTLVYALSLVPADVPPNNPPATPVPTSPLDEAVLPEGAVTLIASSFNDPDGDDHAETIWEVWRADTGMLFNGYPLIVTPQDPSMTLHEITETLEAGLKYDWRVAYVDSDGNESWSREYSFKVGVPEDESLPPVPSGTDVGDFGMISIVHWPDNPSPTAVFGIDYDPRNYRIGTYDAVNSRYIEFGNNLEMEPGRSYWILAREGLNINFSGIPVSQEVEVYVALDYNSEYEQWLEHGGAAQ